MASGSKADNDKAKKLDEEVFAIIQSNAEVRPCALCAAR
jgi:hypothetical protein